MARAIESGSAMTATTIPASTSLPASAREYPARRASRRAVNSRGVGALMAKGAVTLAPSGAVGRLMAEVQNPEEAMRTSFVVTVVAIGAAAFCGGAVAADAAKGIGAIRSHRSFEKF